MNFWQSQTNLLTFGSAVANRIASPAAGHSVLRPNSILVHTEVVVDHLQDFLVQDIQDMDT
jgi:hypothetical protein